MLKNQEPAARWFFSGFLLNFQHGTQPFIILLEQAALNGLFQQTSGAWIYLVHSVGTITTSILFSAMHE